MFLLLMSLCQTGAETIINSYEHVKLRTTAVAFPKSSKKYILINTTSKVNSKFTQNIYSMIKSIMFDERDYLIVMSLSLHIPHCSYITLLDFCSAVSASVWVKTHHFKKMLFVRHSKILEN